MWVMAGQDDDYEKLLREVEGVLGGGKPAGPSPDRSPERAAGREPERQPESSPAGLVDRMRAGLPIAVAVGAVSGAVVGLAFGVLPFVDGFSGALGALVTGTAVSLAGRLRRR
jgi:hypothetical protein